MNDKSILVNNATSEELHVYFKYCATNKDDKSIDPQCWDGGDLRPPPTPWSLTGIPDIGVTMGANIYSNDTKAGAGRWQILTLPQGKQGLVTIPFDDDFTQSFSIRAVKYFNGEPTQDYPILYETNLKGVGDLSAVDGVNYLLSIKQSYGTNPNDYNDIKFVTNPCEIGQSGCVNPSIDGTFNQVPVCLNNLIPGRFAYREDHTADNYIALDYGTYIDNNNNQQTSVCWNSIPAESTDNLCGKSCEWCRYIEYTGDNSQYKAYCYSHNDTSSSPPFNKPWKAVLTYSDLDAGNSNRIAANNSKTCNNCPKVENVNQPNITKNAQPIRNCVPEDKLPQDPYPSDFNYYCPTSQTGSNEPFTDCIYQCVPGSQPTYLPCAKNYPCQTGFFYCPSTETCFQYDYSCPDMCISIGPPISKYPKCTPPLQLTVDMLLLLVFAVLVQKVVVMMKMHLTHQIVTNYVIIFKT